MSQCCDLVLYDVKLVDEDEQVLLTQRSIPPFQGEWVMPGGKIGLANWTPDGFVGRLFQVVSQFIPPPAGLRSPMEWGFSVLLFPLHVLGEFIKPMSLSLRLFGNIFGEETLTATFIVLGAGMLAGLHSPVGIPIQVPIMFLGMLTSTIQALVFTLLATVYIALMLPHHEHEEAQSH